MEWFKVAGSPRNGLKVDSFVEALNCGRCGLPAEHVELGRKSLDA